MTATDKIQLRPIVHNKESRAHEIFYQSKMYYLNKFLSSHNSRILNAANPGLRIGEIGRDPGSRNPGIWDPEIAILSLIISISKLRIMRFRS